MRGVVVACLLIGCSYAPSRSGPNGDDDVDACVGCDAGPRLLPSNLDSLGDLDGVTEALVVTGHWRILTSGAEAGRIEQLADTDIRAAGEGLAGGIRFRILDDTMAVIAVEGLSIPAGQQLDVVGTRALIVLARTDIAIAGTLDVAGKGAAPGPGGGIGGVLGTAATGCGPGGGGGGNSGLGEESGAGGGGYGIAGAAGGQGNAVAAGAAGAACGGEMLVPLIAGSGGGHGGGTDNTGGGGGGDGGGGGGAIQLSALGEVRVDATGVIDAGGGGGGATRDDDAGGGGGGSGGAIFLEAPTVIVAAGAAVVANGGGGGAGENPAAEAGAGAAGTRSRKGAAGGVNTFIDNVGEGGPGAAREAAPGEGIDAFDGGGGGGGGLGRIRIVRTTATLDEQLLSPAPSLGDARFE